MHSFTPCTRYAYRPMLQSGKLEFVEFLLRQAFADDEASTRPLQNLLFLLLSTASLMFIPCAIRSSFTLSIHFFGCFLLLLVPFTCPYSSTTGGLFPSILVTCPNHVIFLFLILSTNVANYPPTINNIHCRN